jgi:type III secretion protein U
MGEKTLEPTEHKLEESRKKGQVAVSKDLANCLKLLIAVEATFALEQTARNSLAQLFDLAFRGPGLAFTDLFSSMVASMGTLLAIAFCIYTLICIFSGVVGYWGQFGVLFAPDPLIPSPDKINPLSTIKNIFTMKKLNEMMIAIAKLVVFSIMTYLIMRWELTKIIRLSGGNPHQVYAAAMELLHGLFRVLLGFSLILAILDFFAQKAGHTKQLRMDMEEVIREHKENEGDPLIKSQRRNLSMEILNAAPVARTEEANAVVVNPTHFAVALLFEPTIGIKVPVVCAKGAGPTALAMIERATELGIPVIRHVWLARTLFATARDRRMIPRNLFDSVAFLYTVVEHLNNKGLGYMVLDESESPPKSDETH